MAYLASVFLDASPAQVPFVARLAAYGDAPALIAPEGTLTYAELAGRVTAAAEALGPTRRLVLLPVRPDLDSVVSYLGALAGGHPVLLTEDRDDLVAALTARYDPDVVGRDGGYGERREGTAHDLHPDLALLLSTSGSTGSPRLVRLSGRGVQHNAQAIAEYLQIRSDDVAVTTLPLHYCYGLSVLHSHLATGAAVCLTDLSVVDTCFWDLVRRHRVTALPGVPYTFDLLDRVPFESLDVPSLRYLTVAGGRLAAEQVRRYAELGQRKGFDLFVMYGQTEATARMAWLPPDLATTYPGAIGVPVPGGSLRIDAEPGGEVGELVYEGPNVMMGYAESPADLGLGRVVHELRTGDLARYNEAGLVEIVGRVSRFAKLFGLRLDLDQLERRLTADRPDRARVWCTATEDRLVVGVEQEMRRRGVAGRTTAAAVEITGLPSAAVATVVLDAMPRLPTGKPDYRSLTALAPDPEVAATDVRGLYAAVLGRGRVADDDSFVGLGGDSLSYVEVSVRLEELLGHLPDRWHLRTVAELEQLRQTDEKARRTRAVEITVPLRALSILAIVCGHAGLFPLMGGAHVLIALAGFNLGRFQLPPSPGRHRAASVLRAARRIAVPSALWIGSVAVVSGAYPWYSPLLLNAVVGPAEWSEPAWWYWFIEALVTLLLFTAALLAIPAVDRLERRWPFWLPVGLAAIGLLFRYDLVSLRGGAEIYRAENVLWLFALGWAAARATTRRERLVVSTVAVVATVGFVEEGTRMAVIVLGVLALTWVPHVRLPRHLARAAAYVAGGSLTVYLTHWQIHPPLEEVSPALAYVGSFAGGLLIWQLARTAHRRSSLLRRLVG